MDFDHIPGRGAKIGCLSRMAHSGRFSVAELKREMAKCDVVCACCHRIRTTLRGS